MKFTFEVHVEPQQIVDPLHEDIIRVNVVDYLRKLMQNDADQYGPWPEVWIDISDDGEGKYNVYEIRSIK